MRRTILEVIATNEQGITYTELITELKLPTGKLNYHIEQLSGLIAKNDSRHYILTSFGKKALSHIDLVKNTAEPEDDNYVRAAYLSQRSSIQPALRFFILLGLAVSFFFTFIWSFMAYLAITEGAQLLFM
jgi:predicted transcriptional regulator